MALAMTAALAQAFGATLTVTNLADSGPGTLRDRIAAAAPGDTVTFGVLGTVLLNSELVISKSMNVYGYGGGLAGVSGNHSSRVFNLTSGSIIFLNLAIIDGRVVGTNGAAGHNGQDVYGGGVLIANGASVLMLECMVSNNVVMGGQPGTGTSGGNGSGGGLGNLGTLSLNTCLVVSNYALGGSGGAVGGGGQGYGGGLYTDGSLDVPGSTIYGNIATGAPGGGGNGSGAGGGIYINSGTTTISSSTIISNSAASLGPDSGGGIQNYGTLTIRDSTIVGNQADVGGGITGGNIFNTILAGNSAGTGSDGSGNITSSDYNLIQNTSGITFSGTTTHNITGLDPKLGPLRFNYGQALSFDLLILAPLPGSSVIDQGKNFYVSDQRGFSRPYDTLLLNTAGGNGADIGAVELHPGTLTVANTNDSGAGSLRQALADNAGLGGSNTIVFSNTVIGTITLSSGELTVPVGGRSQSSAPAPTCCRSVPIISAVYSTFGTLPKSRG